MPIFKRQHFSRLLDLAQKRRIAPLYLFVGDVAVARELARKLLAELTSQGALVEEYDLSQDTLVKVRLSLSAPALLGRKVVFAEASKEVLKPDECETLCALLEAGKESRTLVLLVPELADEHPLARFAEKLAVLVPLKKSHKPKDFLQFELPELLAEYGKKMDRSTGELLLELVGDDPAALRQEVEKLALYAGERPVIKKEDVFAVVSPRPEQAPYQLVEALLSRGPEEALKLLRDLVEQGVHYLVFVSTMATFFKRLWLLKYLLTRWEPLLRAKDYHSFRTELEKAKKEVWPEKAPRTIGSVHPYVLFRMKRTAELLTEEKITTTLLRLAAIDQALKSRPVSAEDLFYALFLEIKGLSPGKRPSAY
jgi:DNA polymerase-3 subunit delta